MNGHPDILQPACRVFQGRRLPVSICVTGRTDCVGSGATFHLSVVLEQRQLNLFPDRTRNRFCLMGESRENIGYGCNLNQASVKKVDFHMKLR